MTSVCVKPAEYGKVTSTGVGLEETDGAEIFHIPMQPRQKGASGRLRGGAMVVFLQLISHSAGGPLWALLRIALA